MPDISELNKEQLLLMYDALAIREYQFASTVIGLYEWRVPNDQRIHTVMMAIKTGRGPNDYTGAYTARFYQQSIADRMLVELQIKCAAAVLCGENPHDAQVFMAVGNRWRKQDVP
jgi:hypothetical protein